MTRRRRRNQKGRRGVDKKEWQKFHKLTDKEMSGLDNILKTFNGKIDEVGDVSVEDGIQMEEGEQCFLSDFSQGGIK